ncbi:hypothetical protein BJX62DRAFT_198582 [Aspergillus germanicus]
MLCFLMLDCWLMMMRSRGRMTGFIYLSKPFCPLFSNCLLSETLTSTPIYKKKTRSKHPPTRNSHLSSCTSLPQRAAIRKPRCYISYLEQTRRKRKLHPYEVSAALLQHSTTSYVGPPRRSLVYTPGSRGG